MSFLTNKNKGSLLVYLTAAILIPTLASLLLAWGAYKQFRRSIDYLAVSYVRNMGQVVAQRIATPQGEYDFYKNGLRDIEQIEREASIKAGATPLSYVQVPGIYAVLDENGNALFCSRGSEFFAAINHTKLPIGHPAKALFANGKPYTFAVYQARRGRFLLVAINEKELVGKFWNYSFLWPLLMGLNALLSLCFLYLMWRMVIKPLKKLYEDVSDLQSKGLEKALNFPEKGTRRSADELDKLRSTISTLARSTVQNIMANENYLHDIIKVQEEERAFLAREIHDGPLQDVTALIQRIRLVSLANTQEEAAEKLAQAEQVSMEAVHEMRELCNTLTPPWLELGLRRSLIELADRRGKIYSTQIHTTELDDPQLTEDQTLAFFRVAQQGLSNAEQHAQAQNITLRLIDGDGFVRMEVEDDGIGFDVPENPKEIRTTGHRGLSNMYERMQLIDGSCVITSQKGKGTKIVCEVRK